METEYKTFHKSYYEKFTDGTEKYIEEEIPFDIPETWEWMRWRTVFNVTFCLFKFSKPSMRWRTALTHKQIADFFSKPSMRWRTQSQ